MSTYAVMISVYGFAADQPVNPRLARRDNSALILELVSRLPSILLVSFSSVSKDALILCGNQAVTLGLTALLGVEARQTMLYFICLDGIHPASNIYFDALDWYVPV